MDQNVSVSGAIEPKHTTMLSKERELLLSQVRECFGKVAWSHKTQECQASIYRLRYDYWKWGKILVAVLAAGSGISTLLSGRWTCYVSALLSSLVLLIELVFKERAYDDMANCHQVAATKLWRIREAYQCLIGQILSDDFNAENVRGQMKILADELEQIYLTAPRTSETAYKSASEMIHSGSCSCTDAEIDSLLPTMLRSQHD